MKNLKYVLVDHGATYESGFWTLKADPNGNELTIRVKSVEDFRQFAETFDEDSYILSELDERHCTIYELAEDARWFKEELEGILYVYDIICGA